MVPDDDIFGCFGNTTKENCLACFCPCYLFGKLIEFYNAQPQQQFHKAECNFCTGVLVYGCCICIPCLPGSYFRILRGEEACTGCLSYSLFSCCALLQDKRRLERESQSATSNYD